MKYRKKPVVIEAFCWTGDFDALDAWLNSMGLQEDGDGDSSADGIHESDTEHGVLVIPTEEGEHRAQHGDVIIRGVRGEFYPCKPDIFAATYELADARTPPASAPPIDLEDRLRSAISNYCGHPPDGSGTCDCDKILADVLEVLAASSSPRAPQAPTPEQP